MPQLASCCRNGATAPGRPQWLLCLLIILASAPGCETVDRAGVRTLNQSAAPPAELQSGVRRILQVEDGNTLVLGSGHRVRLLGSSAPEVGHLELPVQRFGLEAAEYLKNIALGRECTLKYEGAGFYDDRGRLLAYVFVNGRMLNEEMIRSGYAYACLAHPFSNEARFMEIEREARARQLGLWDLALRDGRIANLVSKYDSLNKDGRAKLDNVLDELARQYPARPGRVATTTQPRAASPAPAPAALPAPAPVEEPVKPVKPAIHGDAIPWTDAANYYGKKVTIEGAVVETYKSEAVCFLNFNPDYNKGFFAVIHSSVFERFPSVPENFYRGRRVRVSGIVKEFKGRPQIILESPQQIEVLE